MGSVSEGTGEFRCACCERTLPEGRLSAASLENRFGQREKLCQSCAAFLFAGLEFLVARVKAKHLTLIPAKTKIVPLSKHAAQPGTPATSAVPNRVPIRPRAASAMEQEAFTYHSLCVERTIESFIRGLEAGGVSRARLSSIAETALNNLLAIRQTASGQRVRSRGSSRADVRRWRRHLKETEILVEEYILAVVEELGSPVVSPTNWG